MAKGFLRALPSAAAALLALVLAVWTAVRDNGPSLALAVFIGALGLASAAQAVQFARRAPVPVRVRPAPRRR